MGNNEKYVAYLRVSTQRQGVSGLGLQAQQEIIKNYLKGKEPIEEFVEVESGRKSQRPKLHEALELCKKEGMETCIYSGKDEFDLQTFFGVLDYIKLGPYIEELGGLDNPNTNQRLYRLKYLEENKIEKIDITNEFLKKEK